MTLSSPNAPKNLDRRSLVKSAAWSVPVIALATAAPFASASPVVNVGNFRVVGDCGVLAVLGPGFEVTAGAAPLPVDTQILINGSGVANIGLFSVLGGTADVVVLGGTGRRITLTAPLAAGATLQLRTTLSISVAFGLTAALTLPTGYTAGTTAKPNGSVNSTLILCSAT